MAGSEHIIQIPKPCKRDWHQMTPDGTGRFCAHCSKNVIDFTTLTDAQIVALLDENEGKLCGRFENTQLNRVLTDRQLRTQSGNRFKEIFAALLLLVTTKDMLASKPPVEKINITQSQKPLLAEFEDNKDSITAAAGILLGTLVDEQSKMPILGAAIQNLKSQASSFSDEDGKFRISAAPGDTIQIIYLGYASKNFVVRDFKFHTYTLRENTGLIGEIVITKRTLGSRIRHFFHIRHKSSNH